MMLPAERPLPDLFELRCQARREVAEALLRLPEEARTVGEGQRLSEQFLASVHSGAALTEVIRLARALAQQPGGLPASLL
ncbi:hypothetical protein Dcar01_00212 [Deinococcus carri]|uniref:Uncharacterized protein n=1 Tax=Deinococcus carri TaxID=1211323 RepID=A0ABP9W2A3_9DEIO